MPSQPRDLGVSMSETPCEAWGLEEALQKYPRLRLLPAIGTDVRLAGTLAFKMDTTGRECIEDEYQIQIDIPREFPQELPVVRETGERIPSSHHKFKSGALCLGAPPRLSLMISESPTILAFIEKCIIPYLYNFSYLMQFGEMPLGELPHGEEGICEDLESLFGMKVTDAKQFLLLGSLRNRIANKAPCPCGSGRRLGKCHNQKMDELRQHYGRPWFRKQHSILSKYS